MSSKRTEACIVSILLIIILKKIVKLLLLAVPWILLPIKYCNKIKYLIFS